MLKKGANNQMPSRVINIASVAGLSTGDPTSGDGGGLAAPGSGTYSCAYSLSHKLDLSRTNDTLDGPSKAACIHLSKQQASKLAPMNILVNCVCP